MDTIHSPLRHHAFSPTLKQTIIFENPQNEHMILLIDQAILIEGKESKIF